MFDLPIVFRMLLEANNFLRPDSIVVVVGLGEMGYAVFGSNQGVLVHTMFCHNPKSGMKLQSVIDNGILESYISWPSDS